MKLNLGCGDDIRKDYFNLDKRDIDLEKSLPFKDNSVDEILLIHVLEHILNAEQLLRECFRVLKDGGILELEVPNWGHPLTYGDPTHVHYFSDYLMEIYNTHNPDRKFNILKKKNLFIWNMKSNRKGKRKHSKWFYIKLMSIFPLAYKWWLEK